MSENTLKQLKDMLIPLKIYGDINDTMVESELKAYASGIDLVKDNTYKLLQEGFVSTSNDFGLRLIEEMLNLTPSGNDVERKNRIFNKLSNQRGKWNQKYFLDNISSTFDGKIVENFNKNSLILSFNKPQTTTLEDLSTAFGSIKNISPAHLKINSNIKQKYFDEYDTLNKSFMNYDKLDLSFDSVENVS